MPDPKERAKAALAQLIAKSDATCRRSKLLSTAKSTPECKLNELVCDLYKLTKEDRAVVEAEV